MRLLDLLSLRSSASSCPREGSNHRCHLDHGPTHRRGAVDSLLVGIEGSTSSIQFRQCVCDVKDAARGMTSNARRRCRQELPMDVGNDV